MFSLDDIELAVRRGAGGLIVQLASPAPRASALVAAADRTGLEWALRLPSLDPGTAVALGEPAVPRYVIVPAESVADVRGALGNRWIVAAEADVLVAWPEDDEPAGSATPRWAQPPSLSAAQAELVRRTGAPRLAVVVSRLVAGRIAAAQLA